jgi:hypothetical protein
MRWLLLGLPTGLLLGLVVYLSRPEAAPETIHDVPVADNTQSTVGDPITFLENCLHHYDKTVKGYSLLMYKQERIGGRLQSSERIKVRFKEHPFSVYFEWLEGARLAERALYVKGENDDKALARPAKPLYRLIRGNVVRFDVDGPEARRSGRYTLNEFGLKKGTERTLAAWKKARRKKTLHVKYLGTHKVKELNDRRCYKFQAQYDEPSDDGLSELTVYIDEEHLLQVGSILKTENQLVATYFFRDIKLNPKFKKDQFQPAALTP